MREQRASCLIGRDQELSLICAALDEIAEDGRAFVVVGDPGAGKSALLAAAADEAACRGMLVLRTAGSAAEHHLPFAALYQLVHPMLGRTLSLPPRHRAALMGALGLSVEAVAPDPFFIALAVLELIAEVSAGTPVLLVADDVPWVDPPSRDVIDFVARRLEAERAVILLAARTARISPAAYPGATTIELGPLSAEASRALMERDAPGQGPAEAARVLAMADGNPLALLELPLTLGNRGTGRSGVGADAVPLTDELERTFADRFDDLDGTVQSLLLVAALQGSDQVDEALAAMAELHGHSVPAAAFDPAIRAGLVKLEGTTLRFRHSLVRSAIAQRSAHGDRIAAHRALASVVGDSDRAVWHRAMASLHPDEDVAQALDKGAASMLARGAPTLAEDWLERAARLSEGDAARAHRLLCAAELAFEVGRASSVRELTRQARALSLDPTDAARLAGLDGAFDDGVPGDVDHVRRLIHAAGVAQAAGDDGLAATLLIGASMTCYWGAVSEGALGPVRDAAARLRVPDADPRALVIRAVVDPYRDGASSVELLSWWAEQEMPDPGIAAALGRAAFIVSDFERALLFARRAGDMFRAQGRVALLAQTLVLETFAGLHLGRWDVTHVASAEAYRFAVDSEQPVWAACAELGQGALAGVQGDTDRAEEVAGRVEPVVALAGNRALLNGVQLVRGFAALGADAPEQAFRELARMMDPGDDAYQIPQSVWSVDLFADAAVVTGEAERARRVLRDVEAVTCGTPALGARRAVAVARALLADDDEAETRFDEARGIMAAASPWYRARLDLAHGAWLRRQRRVVESRDLLWPAQAVFDALGARAWSARAERELGAAGLRPHRSGPHGWATLSAQELQIAQLAAQGLSNREIGARLYLSHRTVGSHLYRLFPKLGVKSRAQLHEALRMEPVESS